MQEKQLWLWPVEFLGVDPHRPPVVFVRQHVRPLPGWGRLKTPAPLKRSRRLRRFGK
jgi:hypothetical protein